MVQNIDLPVSADFTDLKSVKLGTDACGIHRQIPLRALSLAGNVWDLTKLDDYDTPIHGWLLE